MARKKKRLGRPPFKITADVLRKAEKYASRGLSEGQIATALGIDPTTLIKYKNLNSIFSNAIKEGQAKGIADIANTLYGQAKEGSTSAAIFYLKNRAGWADAQKVEVTTKVEKIERVIVDVKALPNE